jgi:hypothetical protein
MKNNKIIQEIYKYKALLKNCDETLKIISRIRKILLIPNS